MYMYMYFLFNRTRLQVFVTYLTGALFVHESNQYTGLFKMIVRVLTTCHTQYAWDSSICIFYLIEQHSQFLLHTLQVLYMCTLCDSTNINTIIEFVRSKLFVACQRWWFQWRFWFVPSVPGYLREEEEHKPDPWSNPIERNHMGLHLENEVAVVKTPTIISNNPVYVNFLHTQRPSLEYVVKCIATEV